MKITNDPAHLHEVLAHLRGVKGNIPTHRQASKHPYAFSALPFKTQLEVWDELWRTTDDFWVRLHAFFFLERHIKKETELLAMWPVIVKWQQQVDDWGLCDALAKIYTKILEVLPGPVYKQLREWNTSKNLWKRRQSVVSLLYFSRTKKTFLLFEDIMQLIAPLVPDKEYYVQKGVGWALRECHTVYPRQTLAWLSSNIKLVSSIAFTISIEKIGADIKNKLKVARR